MPYKKYDHIYLKWGTIKGWYFNEADCEAYRLLTLFLRHKKSRDCLSDKIDQKHVDLICQIIDALDGTIIYDWTGEFMTKDEAKKYIKLSLQEKSEL